MVSIAMCIVNALGILSAGFYIGGTIEVAMLTKLYLEYRTDTRSDTINNGASRVPDVTVCAYPSSRHFSRLPRGMLTREFFAKAYKLEDIFKLVQLANPEGKWENLSRDKLLRAVLAFKVADFICYSISWTSYYGQDILLLPMATPEFVKVKISRLSSIQLHVFLSAPRSALSLRAEDFARKSGLPLEQQVFVSFTKLETTLLPPPYVTSCRKFDVTGIKSPAMCRNRCETESHIKKWGAVSAGGLVMATYESKNLTFMKMDKTIVEQCKRGCNARSCFEEDMVVKIESNGGNSSSINLVVELPRSHQEVRHSPKVTFLSLLVGIGSSLSLWTGASGLASFRWVKKKVASMTKIQPISDVKSELFTITIPALPQVEI